MLIIIAIIIMEYQRVGHCFHRKWTIAVEIVLICVSASMLYAIKIFISYIIGA